MFTKKYTLWALVVIFVNGFAFASITVKGHIVNGTNKDIRLGGETVMLMENNPAQGKQAIVLKVFTDARGQFSFNVDDSLKNRYFHATTTYQGVEYFGPGFQVNEKNSNLNDLAVFETTDSDSAISVDMEHLIITPANGLLLIKDIFLVRNRSQFTYNGGKQVATDKFASLTFSLPVGANELKVGGELMSCCAVITKEFVYETMPIKPGGREELLSYQISITTKFSWI